MREESGEIDFDAENLYDEINFIVPELHGANDFEEREPYFTVNADEPKRDDEMDSVSSVIVLLMDVFNAFGLPSGLKLEGYLEKINALSYFYTIVPDNTSETRRVYVVVPNDDIRDLITNMVERQANSRTEPDKIEPAKSGASKAGAAKSGAAKSQHSKRVAVTENEQENNEDKHVFMPFVLVTIKEICTKPYCEIGEFTENYYYDDERSRVSEDDIALRENMSELARLAAEAGFPDLARAITINAAVSNEAAMPKNILRRGQEYIHIGDRKTVFLNASVLHNMEYIESRNAFRHSDIYGMQMPYGIKLCLLEKVKCRGCEEEHFIPFDPAAKRETDESKNLTPVDDMIVFLNNPNVINIATSMLKEQGNLVGIFSKDKPISVIEEDKWKFFGSVRHRLLRHKCESEGVHGCIGIEDVFKKMISGEIDGDSTIKINLTKPISMPSEGEKDSQAQAESASNEDILTTTVDKFVLSLTESLGVNLTVSTLTRIYSDNDYKDMSGRGVLSKYDEIVMPTAGAISHVDEDKLLDFCFDIAAKIESVGINPHFQSEEFAKKKKYASKMSDFSGVRKTVYPREVKEIDKRFKKKERGKLDKDLFVRQIY